MWPLKKQYFLIFGAFILCLLLLPSSSSQTSPKCLCPTSLIAFSSFLANNLLSLITAAHAGMDAGLGLPPPPSSTAQSSWARGGQSHNPSPNHSGIWLASSCAGNHSCCVLMNVTAMLCPEDSSSQLCSLSSGSHILPTPSLWCSLSLGSGV